MTTKYAIDARTDQLNILKFEKRFLRPMALKVLDSRVSRHTKLSAIASVSAILLTLQGLPEAYASTLKIDHSLVSQTSHSIYQARTMCDEIAKLVESNSSQSDIQISLENLFALVDSEHACLEEMALDANARLFPGGADNIAGGTGGGGGDELNTATNMKWLNLNKNRVS